MSQLGRIGGQVLTDNLLRAGVDLAFETDLLYLDVNNQQIGIKDSTPVYTLDVNNNIYTNDLTAVTQLAPGNLRLNSPETITTSVGGIDVYINSGGEIFHDRLATANLVLDGNLISSISNSNIVLDPNGSGTVELMSDTNITGDLAVSGNISMSGNLTGLGTLTFGDQTLDTVTINTDFTQSIIPGDDITYAMGADAGDSSARRWAELHSPAWQYITDGAWPGSGIVPLSATISDQITIDGVNNKISTIQSNEDILLSPPTGITYIESLKFGGSASLTYTLSNPTPADGDLFGYSVDIDGDYAIVGAWFQATGSGNAYIYNVTTGALVYTLNNPNTFGGALFDYFGRSVAISGSYAIVGAYGEDAVGANSGRAYIYNVTTGTLVHTLTDPNPYGTGNSDNFGYSVDISGSYAIVGAYGEDASATLYQQVGKAYIYNVTTGALVYTLNNPNAYGIGRDDWFGYSVAISGSYAIVGAYLEDDTGTLVAANSNDSGKAFIYNVTTGALVYTLNNPNPYGTTASDYFGYAVAISGSYAIVGAYLEDDAGGTSSGKAYIYNVTTGALVYTLDNPNTYGTSVSDRFGVSVAISESYAIVGAWGEGDAGGTSSGVAYVYELATGSLVYTITNPNAYGTSADDGFGFTVGVSNNRFIVGAHNEDSGVGVSSSGRAYVFQTEQSIITNLLNTPLTIATTGTGYYVVAGDNAMLIPAGPEGDRRASPAVGETRWNTDVGYIECYDGSTWIVSIGPGDVVSEDDMRQLINIYSLILG
jgi:hypothetical protein